MKAKILKTMVVEGRKLPQGTIVDVKGWKHAKALARNRYIEILEGTVEPVKVNLTEESAEETKPKVRKTKTKEEE